VIYSRDFRYTHSHTHAHAVLYMTLNGWADYLDPNKGKNLKYFLAYQTEWNDASGV
jgi:hypothetical protein